jgi:hypothetical protein
VEWRSNKIHSISVSAVVVDSVCFLPNKRASLPLTTHAPLLSPLTSSTRVPEASRMILKRAEKLDSQAKQANHVKTDHW